MHVSSSGSPRDVKSVLGIVLIVSLLFTACSMGSHHTETGPQDAKVINTKLSKPFTLTPIDAKFAAVCFCTTYVAHIYDDTFTSSDQYRSAVIDWSLELKVVDGDAGMTSPESSDSSGAVDPGCDNAGNGTTKAALSGTSVYNSTSKKGDFTLFIWTHPDPPSSQPPGKYHCDHSKMGPHGHEGIVTLSVTTGGWRCRESYLGTNTGIATDANQKPYVENDCAATA